MTLAATNNKIWLGIDPGLAILGWAILQDRGKLIPDLVDFGTIETSKELSTARRLAELEKDLIWLVRVSPQGIAVEMPYFDRQIRAAGGVMQALGIISLVSYREGQIEPTFCISQAGNVTWAMVGPNKQEVGERVKRLFGLEQLPIDDSVDAIAIAYAAWSGVRNEIR